MERKRWGPSLNEPKHRTVVKFAGLGEWITKRKRVKGQKLRRGDRAGERKAVLEGKKPGAPSYPRKK